MPTVILWLGSLVGLVLIFWTVLVGLVVLSGLVEGDFQFRNKTECLVMFLGIWLAWMRLFWRKPPTSSARWVHFAYAMIHAYSWLPCPMCGCKFGAHEEGVGSIPMLAQPGCGESVCPRCALESQDELSRRWSEAHTQWSRQTIES